MIAGRLYPAHLAVSNQQWKIHYFSADMADNAEHRAEDEAFLRDMPRVLGARAMSALEGIRDRLGLDYAGIDFGLDDRGNVLFFEANASMTIHPPAPDERWLFRRARSRVARILDAARNLFVERAGGRSVTECLLFLSHHTQPGAMAALANVMEQCGSRFTVVPLFDQTKQPYPIDHIPRARGITCAQVTRLLPYRKKHSQHPGTFWSRNIDLPLMWYFHESPHYDYYWVVEYDVRFTGSWLDFFRHFAANESDLLATTLFDYSFRPGWDNWATLKSPERIPDQDRVRALFPLYRLSNAALRALHEAYCEGWSGHYESDDPHYSQNPLASHSRILAVPAVTSAPGNHDRFYRNSPDRAGLAPGTFTVAANAIRADYPPNLLWHPIKG